MKSLKLIWMLIVLVAVLGPRAAQAQFPDCSTEEGTNLVGLVWEDNSFTMFPHDYTPHTATLVLFNTTSWVRAWEMRLDYDDANLTLLNVSLLGTALNAGTDGDFVVGLTEPLMPNTANAVALANFTFISATEDVVNLYANPVINSTQSLPGEMAYLTFGYAGSDSLVAINPIGGFSEPGVSEPIGNIDNMWGIELPYCPAPNQSPTADFDLVETDEDIPITFDILANDSDPDGYLIPSTVQLLGPPPPLGGEFIYDGDGLVTYTPPPESSGTDLIYYTVEDNEGAVSNQSTIWVTVNNVNDPPVALDDSGFTERNVGITIDLLSNDTDVDNALDPASLILSSTAEGGFVTDNGDGTVLYMPGYFTYDDHFTYTVADISGAVSNPATVTVAVTQPYAPIEVPDCTGEGENMLGIVWENGQFSMPDAPTTGEIIYGRIYVFNPSGGTVDGFAFDLEYDSYGTVGVTPVMPYPGTFIPEMYPSSLSYMLDEPLVPGPDGAVPIAEVQVNLEASSGVDIYANPAIVITQPVTEYLWTGGDPGNVTLNLLGDDITPIGSLNGVDLAYCETLPPQWTDVTSAAGLPEDVGGRSSAWCDFDNDGDEDLYIGIASLPSRLYRNNADGTFTDITTPETAVGADVRPVVWADPDNDGNFDLLIGRATRSAPTENVMLWSDGIGGFTQSTDMPLGAREPCNDINWIDYNLDGKLDVLLDTGSLNGSRLLRNLDGHLFLDVTDPVFSDNTNAFCSSWADYDLDGDLDVFVVSRPAQPCHLLRNDGDGVFTDVTPPALNPGNNPYAAAWADFDNDGDPDLFIGGSDYPNHLIRNDGSGVFTDVTPALMAGTEETTGMAWFDANNDGHLDLFILNREAANILALNNGDGTWSEGDYPALQLEEESLSVSAADYDQDGDLDLFLSNGHFNSPSYLLPGHLLRNEQNNGNHWLEVGLTGTYCTRQAVGARIEVLAGGMRQTRWLGVGEGFWNQHQQAEFFGLGNATVADSVIVVWPSINDLGQHHRTWLAGVPVDQVIEITEETDSNFDIDFAPVVAYIGDQIINDDDDFAEIDLDEFVWTDNTTSPINWSYAGNTFLQVSITDGVASITYPDGWSGEETITFTAEVNGLLGSLDVPFTVLSPDVAWADITPGSGLDAFEGGKGISWGDYDGDSDQDLFITATPTLGTRLMRNNGNGLFEDVTTPAVHANADSRSSSWCDPDNDGDLDIYVTFSVYGGFADHFMSWNNGDGTFTQEYLPPLDIPGSTESANWLDYDQDGWQDVFVARGATGHSLFRNLDGYQFLDVTQPPLDDPVGARTSCWADYDLDGDLDLYLVQSEGGSKLFRYDGENNFTNVTPPLLAPGYWVPAGAWGDYDNDGDPDLYLVIYNQPNRLLNNEGGVFSDVTPPLLEETGSGMGLAWLDYDNDGDLDLYVLNQYSANHLYRNDGGSWSDQTPSELMDSDAPSLATAFADFDQDGDLDLFVTTNEYMGYPGPNHLVRNDLDNGNHWLQLDLVGTYSHRLAVGAKVEVHAGTLHQTRWVPAGSGLFNQHQHALSFGLGAYATVDSVRITWPRKFANGNYNSTLLTGVAADQFLTVTEEISGAPAVADMGELTVFLSTPKYNLDLGEHVSGNESAAELSWEVSGNPDLNVTIVAGVATIQPKLNAWFGTNTITFTGTDSRGLSDSGEFSITWNHAFDQFVEIVTDAGESFYAGTRYPATEAFDPLIDQLISSVEPTLRFAPPSGFDDYAYVRHMLTGSEMDLGTATLDGQPYYQYFGEYRAVPLGEFCFYECIWNDGTGEYDCGDDCQYELEAGRFYSMIWTPAGQWADISLIEESDEVWLRTDSHPIYDATGSIDQWEFEIEVVNNDPDPVTRTLQFNPSFAFSDGIGLKLWDETEGQLFDLWSDSQYTFEVPGNSSEIRSFILFVGTPGTTGDTDGDGVPDVDDACPGEDASFFDRDGDGCIDPVIGGRHLEYWGEGTFPLEYVVDHLGVDEITDDSDLPAIQQGFAAWDGLAGTEIAIEYGGETTDLVADSFDGINTVTFHDGDYDFIRGTVAVGLSTSFTETATFQGQTIRPGQIVDTDVIFNDEEFNFCTPTNPIDGALDLQSIITHEAGHMLGLSHSAVKTSTMFYVLQPDTTGTSLEREDRLAMFKAYYTDAAYTGTTHLQGTVTSGWTGRPVAGAIVFVVDVVAGDTLGCDFTLPDDGTFHFIGLPVGETLELSIHPLDGSEAIGYLQPISVNRTIDGAERELFDPEFWNSGDSASEESLEVTQIVLGPGETFTADFVTNVDTTGPSIIAVSPASGATEVPLDAAVLFRCDEAIDPASLAGNFNLSEVGVGTLIPGNAALVEDDRTLSYTLTDFIKFETQYELRVGGGITDRYGNEMGSEFVMTFTTQQRPPLSMDSLSPRKGVAGSLVVIIGEGFSPEAEQNAVYYDSEGHALRTWDVLQNSPNQLVVQVPDDLEVGVGDVYVVSGNTTSNRLLYTVLPPGEEARGLETAAVDLFALPRKVEAHPAGDMVYVATDYGLSYVDVSDPSAPVHSSAALGLGLKDLDLSPGGNRVYGIGAADNRLHVWDTQDHVTLFEETLDFRLRGILVDPSGRRAYLATEYSGIQILDINEGYVNFLRPIGALQADGIRPLGAMACDPAGNYLLAAAGGGKLLVFDLNTFELHTTVEVMPSPRDVVVDPYGERAYVTDESGYVSIVSLGSFARVMDITCGGEMLGSAIDPMGSFVYAVNHQLDNLDVIDLRIDSASYRSISTRLPQQTNPVDVALSPGGLYAYVICETDQRLAVNTVGAGPMLASLSRRSGPAGAKVVLSGVDFEGGRVSFAGAPVDIEGQPTDTAVTVSVPADAGSGTVMVLGAEPGELSNGIEFQVLEATPPGALRLSAAVQPAGQPALTGAVAANSNDRMVAVGGQDGRVHLLNTDPNTSQFNSFVGETAPLGGPVSDLVCSPDGLTVYAVSPEDPVVRQFNINPGSASFAGQLSAVTLDGGAPVSAALSPDGRTLLTADGTSPLVHVIDWANGNVQTVAVGSQPGRLTFHPAGQHAYVVTTGGLVAMDMAGPVLAPVSVDGLPVDLVFSPDGSRCYVLVEPSSSGDRTLVILNTETPGQPSVLNSLVFPAESGLLDERLVLSPAGDRLLLHLREVGLVLVDVANGYRITQPDIVAAGAEVGLAFATSGSLVYAAAAEDATVRAFDFSDAMQLAKVWGDDQTAVVNTVLESSLRVRVTDQATGEGLAGVPVTFNIDTQAKLASGAPVTLGQTATVDKLQILKATNHVKPPLDVLKGGKMGGDTWEDAVVVPGLPYTDTGNTWNATDDYDEACPYGGSTAPDVVYAFTSDFDGAIAVDLCGSSYDTKVFVYANAVTPGEPWACNDDFYLGDPNCLDWVSLVPEMVVYEGDTYYIVVDGFNGGGGDYVLNLTKKYEMNPAGYLVTDDPDSQPTTLTMGTDQYGFADVRWNLGLRPGTQFLEAGVLGADDSPQTFTARALLNQDHLDFELVESRLAPQPDATDVAVTTAVQVSFTRPLDTALFTEDKFFLSADGGATAAPSVLGLTDDNTTATLIPRGVLEYGTVYTVVLGPQIYATNGEQLTPYFFTFTTEPAPPGPELLGVNPPAAIPLTTVMLTGSGFSPDPALNTVTFGQLTAPVSLAEPDYIITKVPLGSLPGLTTVTVTVGGQVTEAMPFNVLAPTLDGPDEVVVRVPTGSGTKAATVSPDGAVLYAVAPEADVVIPVDLVNFTTLPSIPVGDMPWAITRHPDGDLVFVANRMSGDLTSIGIDPDLTGYHRGVGNVGVGAQPVDLVITPAGDRVLVANEESQELTVVDADSKSATYNSVVKRVPVSQGAKAVTVSPDGARIYLGTDEGYILIGAVDYGVVRRVPVSQGAKAVTVSPDGALLVYLDQAGDIWIFDVGVGSDREDQIVARVPMSSGAKAATVSPDGARLYVVPDESDLIYVYALDIGTSVGVVGQPGGAPPMELELVQTLTAGENPQMVVFDPTGSGRFMVPNAGDNTISVFDQAFGSITGFLQAECDGAVSPLAGVEVDIFRNLDGLLAASVMTDENGHYSQSLPQGSYNVTLVTPLGYTLPTEEVGQEVVAGQSHTVDWQVYCEPVIPDQRKMSFWKHQLALALLGLNNYEISGDELCSYLDLIEGHFNNNAINEVRVYDPPESDLCMDKLQVAKDLLNLDGDEDMLAKAKQELLALLFNVASDKLSLRAIISEDGANVSRAITFVDGCIDDGDPANDEQAMKIAKNINKGKMVDAGLIPETIPDIFYSPVATHFHLDQNYPNPFNPECRIRFGVPKPGLVRLKIFDVSGRLVRTLVDENLRTGTYIKVWNGTDSRGLPVASGVYFYKMEAGSFVRTRKMLLMK